MELVGGQAYHGKERHVRECQHQMRQRHDGHAGHHPRGRRHPTRTTSTLSVLYQLRVQMREKAIWVVNDVKGAPVCLLFEAKLASMQERYEISSTYKRSAAKPMRRRERALQTEKMIMVRCWCPSSPTSDSIMLPMLEMNISPTPTVR